MYTGLKHLHSGMAYLALLALILAVLMVLIGFFGKKSFTPTTKKVTLVALILSHLQLVVGIILYFVSHVGFKNLSGEVMKDSVARLNAVEHPLTMIIAIILITIGYSRAKRREDSQAKLRSFLIFYGLGLFLILLRIPWSIWP